MDINKQFEQAREKEAQERWYLTAQLSKNGRTDLAALEQHHKEELDLIKRIQEANYKKDIDRELGRLLEKEGLELHYRPVWGQGSILSEEQMKKLAEHNVIIKNHEETMKVKNEHLKSHDSVLSKEGLFIGRGNSKEILPQHFNERSGGNKENQGRTNGRDR